jgi:hypothetical protein
MSAFYLMKYIGEAGVGGGTLFIGKGLVIGADIQGGKLEGSYTVANGRMRGAVKMTAPSGGASLVTGQHVPAGATFNLNFDFPADTFADGTPQHMIGVGGRPLKVMFEKIRDLPTETAP